VGWFHLLTTHVKYTRDVDQFEVGGDELDRVSVVGVLLVQEALRVGDLPPVVVHAFDADAQLVIGVFW